MQIVSVPQPRSSCPPSTTDPGHDSVVSEEFPVDRARLTHCQRRWGVERAGAILCSHPLEPEVVGDSPYLTPRGGRWQNLLATTAISTAQ